MAIFMKINTSLALIDGCKQSLKWFSALPSTHPVSTHQTFFCQNSLANVVLFAIFGNKLYIILRLGMNQILIQIKKTFFFFFYTGHLLFQGVSHDLSNISYYPPSCSSLVSHPMSLGLFWSMSLRSTRLTIRELIIVLGCMIRMCRLS